MGKSGNARSNGRRKGDEDDKGLSGIFSENVDEKNLSKAGMNALAVIYCNLGNLKRQDGQSFAEAQDAYKKSLDIGGENAAVYNNLALLYISANRFEDAERMLDHALKLQPHFECALSNQLKLRALVQQGNGHSGGDDRIDGIDVHEGDGNGVETDDEFID